MKKSIAMIAAIIMAGSVLSACGKSDDNSSDAAAAATTTTVAAEESKAEESKAEESKAEETTTAKAAEEAPTEESKSDAVAEDEKADESKADDSKDTADGKKAASGEIGELTKAYNEKISGNVFSMEVKVDMPMLGQETNMKYSRNGDNFNMTANLLGMNMDVYKVGDKAVAILTDLDAYIDMPEDQLSSFNMDTYALQDGAVFDGTEEKDGFTVENYTLDEDGVTTKYAYYYDDKGDLKKVILSNDWTGEVTAEYNSLSFEPVDIKLPDTSKLEKYDPENPSPEMSTKMMCAMFGITPEMVEKSGYTYKKISEMDEDKQMEAITKIAEENGLDMDGLLGSLMGGIADEEAAAE